MQIVSTKGTIGNYRSSALGAAMKVSLIDLAPSITNASGKEAEVGEIKNLGSAIDLLDSTEDNQEIVIDKAIFRAAIYGSQPFMMVPALVLLENGESFATTEVDGEDPYSAIMANITGQHLMKLGGEITPKAIMDEGVPTWITNLEWDLTKECNDYAKHVSKTLLDEDNTLVLSLVYWIRTQDTAAVIAIRGTFSFTYHLKPASLSSINYP
jgi:hypothetical protein